MTQYSGQSVCGGIAIAPALRLVSHQNQLTPTPTNAASSTTLEQEYQRFQRACQHVSRQLEQTYTRIANALSENEAAIFLGQQAMLEDPSFLATFQKHLEVCHRAEHALQKTLATFEAKFAAMSAPLFRERVYDLQDVWSHVLAYLVTGSDFPALHLTSPVILVGQELLPSQLADLDWSYIKGVVTAHGGPSSHTALLACAMQIPYIYNVTEQDEIQDGQTIVLDGDQAWVCIDPPHEMVCQYQEKLDNLATQQAQETAEWHSSFPDGCTHQTACGVPLLLRTNVSLLHDIPDTLTVSSDGIGLFRTEIVFASRPEFPTEEEQTQLYESVLKQLFPQTVTFRAFDLGGDKTMLSYPASKDSISPLGWRGIRALLDQPEILKPQLRALLRASTKGSLRVMFPMLSAFEEWERLQDIIAICTEEVEQSGGEVSDLIEWGLMIETPSAAYLIDQLAPCVDFISIGTNDMLQFLMAAERNNPKVNQLLKPTQPALLRLLKNVVEQATPHCHVSLCGDVAAQPRYLPLLLGLGLRELSVPPKQLPLLQRHLLNLTLKDAEALVQDVLPLSSSHQIEARLEDFAASQG